MSEATEGEWLLLVEGAPRPSPPSAPRPPPPPHIPISSYISLPGHVRVTKEMDDDVPLSPEAGARRRSCSSPTKVS